MKTKETGYKVENGKRTETFYQESKQNPLEEGTLKMLMKEYKHLRKFYKTKKEFKQHLLSGEVKISIPDMIKFINK